MSMRVEWALAPDITIERFEAGEGIDGYEEPVTAPFGLLMDGGSGGGYMVEGTAEELRAFAKRFDRAVRRTEEIQSAREHRASNQARFTPHKYRAGGSER